MADISIPYVQRKLARPSPGGTGGGGGGVVRQPRIPDVSQIYSPVQQIGEDISDVGVMMGRIGAQQRKARDIATLTEFETGFDEAIGMEAIDIKSNTLNHPDDWADMLAASREKLFNERSKGLRADLRPLAKAKAYKGTERTLIDLKGEGAALGIKRALSALDIFEDQMSGKLLTERNEAQHKILRDTVQDKYDEYQEAGYLSADDRLAREYKLDQRVRTAGVELDMAEDGKGTLKALQAGEYAGLSAETRVKLIDKAQVERREQGAWQDAEDRRAEKAVSIQQNERESQLREQGYAMGGGAGFLRILSEARQAREIGPDQHDRLMSFGINLQTARESQAAARASRAASAAARNEIAQRRADENQAGKLIALRNAGMPDATGQVVTDDTIIGMAASGKLNWTVAGRVSQDAATHQRMLDNEGNSAKKEGFNLGRQQAQAMFEFNTGRPVRDSVIDQAYAGFLNRYTVAVMQEGMDPQKALETFAPQYMAQAEALETARVQVLNTALPQAYQAPSDQGYAGLEAAKKQLAEDVDAQVITLSDARAHARTLKEFEAYSFYRQPAAKPAATPTPGAPAVPQASGEGFLGKALKNMRGATGKIERKRQ